MKHFKISFRVLISWSFIKTRFLHTHILSLLLFSHNRNSTLFADSSLYHQHRTHDLSRRQCLWFITITSELAMKSRGVLGMPSLWVSVCIFFGFFYTLGVSNDYKRRCARLTTKVAVASQAKLALTKPETFSLFIWSFLSYALYVVYVRFAVQNEKRNDLFAQQGSKNSNINSFTSYSC